MTSKNRATGLTLLELLVAMAVATTVLGVAFQLSSQMFRAASMVMDRTEMQSELRAAFNELSRDLAQAGTSFPPSQITIPSVLTGGTNPKFGCYGATPYLTVNNSLPLGHLYKINPGYLAGPTTTEQTDAVVIAYLDPSLDWTTPQVSNAITPPPLPAIPTPVIAADGSSLTMPSGITPAVDDTALGISVGDVLLIRLQSGTANAVGVVTRVNGPTRVISFANGLANGDPLNINQSGAPAGNIQALKVAGVYPPTMVSRLMMVTYFIQQDTATSTLRLMRQIGAHKPSPVAENIEDLKFTYVLVDDAGTFDYKNSKDAMLGTPPTAQPNLIRQINVTMTIRSAHLGENKTYQRIVYSSSIGPRNLSFRDRYK